MADQQEKEFELVTTAQVERTYRVKAVDADTAHKRLRRYLEDPEMAREGVVRKRETEVDTTPQRVKTESIREMTGPRAVDDDPTGADAGVPSDGQRGRSKTKTA